MFFQKKLYLGLFNSIDIYIKLFYICFCWLDDMMIVFIK
jgi:hypothetical protein